MSFRHKGNPGSSSDSPATSSPYCEALFRLVDSGEVVAAWRGPDGDSFRLEPADDLQQVTRLISGGLGGP